MKTFIAGAGIAVAALLLPGDARAEALRVAMVESLSGSQASTGLLYKSAIHYVIDKINADGGYNGEPIAVSEYDSAGNASEASARFKQAVADGARVIIQGSSSAIAGQISEDVRKYNLRNPGKPILYLNIGADAMELTGEKCHFYSFRFTGTGPMRVNGLLAAMKQEGVLGTKVFSINQNYSWGKDIQAAATANAGAYGYTIVDDVLHEVNKIQDFAPYVARIQSTGAETVITGNWSNDLLLLMKAAGNAGLKVRFATAFLDQPGNISNAGAVALGHYVASPYNIELTDGAFPEDYRKATGHLPVYVEPTAVNGLKMFAAALKAAQPADKSVDVQAIALALENVSLKTDIGVQTIRREDHQTILPIVVSRVDRGVKYPVDGTDMGFKPVLTIPAEEAVYPVQASCRMKRPS